MSAQMSEQNSYSDTLAPETHHSERKLTLVILITALVYLPALQGQWVWDDHLLLAPERLATLDSVFSPYLPSQDGSLPPYFRPLVTLSFWLDAHLHGLNAVILHAENLVLHCINTWLMMRLARKGFGVNPDVAALAGLLFALHPMRVESVAWIAGRPDLLATCLVLSSVLFAVSRKTPDVSQRDVRRNTIGETLLYGAALFSKESAAPLPVWLLQAHGQSTGWRRWLRGSLVGSGVMLCAYAFLRMRALEAVQVRSFPEESLFHRLIGSGRILLAYLERWLWPQAPCAHWELTPLSLAPGAWAWGVGLTGLALLLLLSGYVFLRRTAHRADENPLVVSGLAWMLIFLLPVLGWIPIDETVAERYFYLPAVGLSWSAASLLIAAWHRRPGRQAVLASSVLEPSVLEPSTLEPSTFEPSVLASSTLESSKDASPFRARVRRGLFGASVFIWLVFCVFYTIQGIRHWENDRTLFVHEVTCAPDSGQALLKLGEILSREGQAPEATRALEQAISREPGLVHAYALLAAMALERGDAAAAASWLHAAPASGFRTADQLGLVSRVQLALGETERAQTSLTLALEMAPDRVDFLQDLALMLLRQGRYGEAEATLTRLLERGGESAESHTNRGIARMAQKKQGEALADFRQAYRLGEGQPELLCNLGRALVELGQLEEGCALLSRCLASGMAPPLLEDLAHARCTAPQ